MKRLRDNKVRVLLFGYNGENNTGSESRLVTIVEDIRKTLGEYGELELVAIALSEENVRRYLKDPKVRIIELGTSWPIGVKWIPKVLGLVFARYDLLILVEGSTFTDHFSSFLLYSYLFGTLLAKPVDCKVVAYAVDCGDLKPLNQKFTKWIANKMDLLIARSYDARDKLKRYGVTKEVFVTTDTAFQYKPPGEDYTNDLLRKLNLDPKRPLIGFAPKEFFWWPVTIRFFGPKEDLYRYPYYHTWGRKDRENSEKVKKEFAKYADYCIKEHNANLLIFCMERMDYPPSKDVYELMEYKDRARLIPSNDYNLKDITGLLSKLKFLTSTRYHACVLSMVSSIPMISVSHDVRCESLFKETEIMEYYIPHSTENLYQTMVEKTKLLVKNEEEVKTKVKSAYPKFLDRCLQNRQLLKGWFEKTFEVRGGKYCLV